MIIFSLSRFFFKVVFWTLNTSDRPSSLCGHLVGTNTAILNLFPLDGQSQALEPWKVVTQRDFIPVFCSRPGIEVAFIMERKIIVKGHMCITFVSLRPKHTNPSLAEAVEAVRM